LHSGDQAGPDELVSPGCQHSILASGNASVPADRISGDIRPDRDRKLNRGRRTEPPVIQYWAQNNSRRGSSIPRSIAGLQLWLDAADASTLTFDGSSNVSQWSDKSGNANNAVQVAVNSNPGTTTINGLTALNFDGTDDRLSIPHVAALSPASYTIFAVVDNDNGGTAVRSWLEKSVLTDGTNRKFLYGTHAATTSPFNVANSLSDLSSDSTTALGNGIKLSSQAANTNPAVVAHGKDASVVARMWVNGSQVGFQNTPNTNSINTSPILIGGRAEYPWLGKIAEVLIYNVYISDANRQIIEAYLKAKWGTP
jgi:hypothetical protein